jgi:hypothetical protein
VSEAAGTPARPAERLEEFKQLLDQASEAFEAHEGHLLKRLWVALSVFRGRWDVAISGMLAWASVASSAGFSRAPTEEVEHVVEEAVRRDAAAEVGDPPPSPDEPAVATTDPAAAATSTSPATEAGPLLDSVGRTAGPAEQTEAARSVSLAAEERQRQRDEDLLTDIRGRREGIERELEADGRQMRFFELLVASLLVLAAVIALTIATIGAVTILNNPAAGAVVAAVALVPGGGAAILFRLWRTIGHRRAENAAARERNRDALESLQARLSVSDQRERDRMIGDYAAALRSK